MTRIPGEDHSVFNARIDAALHVYGRAVPAPGLDSRVAARLTSAARQSFHSPAPESRRRPMISLVRRFSVGALAAAAACGIVIGTVHHSQQIALPQRAATPRSGGASTAGAAHIPTRAIPSSSSADPSAPRSRAVIAPDQARKGAKSPAIPARPDSGSPQQ